MPLFGSPDCLRLAIPGCVGGGQNVSVLPLGSDIYLFGNSEGIINLNAEISDGTFYLRMAEKQLNRPEISGPPVYQCRLGSPQRMCAKQRWI